MIGESPLLHHRSPHPIVNVVEITKKDVRLENNDDQEYARKKPMSSVKGKGKRYFLKMPVLMVWIWEEIRYWVRLHPIPCLFAPVLFFLMKVEYTHTMVMHGSAPFDWGFVATKPLHRFLASHPDFNSSLAGLNTAILAMQIGYLFYAWLSERRTRGIIAMVFMLVGRGILGCATVLPVPEGYLGSGVDFPAGNVSFFLFYSGHVGVSYIATLDMKRTQRLKQAKAFDIFNILQGIRLLSIRGHYTIDLVAGIGAAILSDLLAGNYFESGENVQPSDTKIISSQMRLDDDRTVKGLSITECNW